MPAYALASWVPELDPESWIAPNAAVIGKVQMARNTSVWWNVTVRGDRDWIRIGEESNVQDGSVLHTDQGIPLVIGREVTIGHLVTLHGCTIGDRSLIGMGAVILNGASIGADSLVGAHTLIPEGKTFPERSLIVGAPGKLVRQLSDEEVARLPGSAGRYVANWQRYQRDLRELKPI
ncbi:gamma carbonic anhydrase family protein [Propionivibrio soli]|uniref:gamma carbonic anhydrase family protein n=1 Tax=Propionivibrio soli TaxID=2976531 RepID=UPI0021E78273|nr:gamma carbonic anhydrase family protein [Propionivibrio soli]